VTITAAVGDVRKVTLENERLRVELLPDFGGRIWSFVDKSTGRDWLWHNDAVELRSVPLGTEYDPNWSGGWEEVFPNDADGEFRGERLPDHGEWWSLPWTIVEDDPPHRTCRLTLDGPVSHARCEKVVTLDAGRPSLRVRYTITNRRAEPFWFLLKLHAPIAITPRHRLRLPGGRVLQVDRAFSSILAGAGPYDWPRVPSKEGGIWDLELLPPAGSRQQEFVYVVDLPAGWCGVADIDTGTQFTLSYSRNVFPYVWLFMAFGGWHDCYTVVLEPCTNLPKDLNEAFHRGTCASLDAGATLECDVTASIEPLA
jgi:galactose mutarotase-like enzyme